MKTKSNRTDRAFIFYVDGTKKYVEPKNGTDFKLKEIKELLSIPESGMVQYVPLRSKKMELWCDEEGMFNGSKKNEIATMYCAVDAHQGPNGIMGNVLICEPGMVK